VDIIVIIIVITNRIICNDRLKPFIDYDENRMYYNSETASLAESSYV